MTHGHPPGDSPQGSPPQEQPPAQDYGAPHQEESNGCGGKILWILLGIGGLSLLLCCGVGAFLYSKADFAFDVTEDPEAATALTEELVDIDIPAGFEPEGTLHLDMMVMEMELAFYEHAEADGSLAIAEMDVIGSDDEDVAAEMRDSMEQSGVDDDGEDLRLVSVDSRTFEIRGEPAEFEFAELEDRETGEPYRQISGAYLGRDRPFGAIWLLVEEDHYDEDATVHMIESIE